jgi:hypothetical protein
MKEFDLDTLAFTSPSGQYARICPRCKERTYFTKDAESLIADNEVHILLQRLRQTVDSGDFDILKLKKDLRELRSYQSFRFGLEVTEFIKYANKKIEEAGG